MKISLSMARRWCLQNGDKAYNSIDLCLKMITLWSLFQPGVNVFPKANILKLKASFAAQVVDSYQRLPCGDIC